MTPLILPKPGSQHGPCAKLCKHVDCRQTRSMAKEVCPFCAKAIGFDALYYWARLSGNLAHAICLETAIERNDARVGLF